MPRHPLNDASQIDLAAAHMGIVPDHAWRAAAQPPDHCHVAIAWNGGVLWLDMSEQTDHYCVDVRQFRDGELLPIGTWGMIQGRRLILDDSDVAADQRMTAHGWTACPMPVLLTDK